VTPGFGIIWGGLITGGAGWTKPLLASSSAFAGAASVAAALADREGVAVLSSATDPIDVIAPASCGKLRFNYSSGDFEAARSPYRLRFRLEAADGTVTYAPSRVAIEITVRPY